MLPRKGPQCTRAPSVGFTARASRSLGSSPAHILPVAAEQRPFSCRISQTRRIACEPFTLTVQAADASPARSVKSAHAGEVQS